MIWRGALAAIARTGFSRAAAGLPDGTVHQIGHVWELTARGTQPQDPVMPAPRRSSRSDDLVEASLRRLLVSDRLLGRAAATVQLTRTLVGASYKRLGRIAQEDSGGAVQARPSSAGGIVAAPNWVTSGMVDMAGWHHPCDARYATRAVLGRTRHHANDAGIPSIWPVALRAADLACLAQAAILLGLADVAEALTNAAYHVLNGDVSTAVEDAASALRTALTIVRHTPTLDQ